MKQRLHQQAPILFEAPRKESGSDSGSDEGSDSGSNEGSDKGSDKGSDSGANSDSGSNSGSDAGVTGAAGASRYHSAAACGNDVGWAKEAPLTDAGFQSVAETCCF